MKNHGDRLAADDSSGLATRTEVYPPLTDVLNGDVPGSAEGQLAGGRLPGIVRARDLGLGRKPPRITDLPPSALFVGCTVVIAVLVNG